ncbi:LITAF-like zinc ribbon domain-containing protein [Zopfochytrium polystomum]|nr:LITAF-like zinc ribbon domain-containing protein [Zopfochytrium polystomum]
MVVMPTALPQPPLAALLLLAPNRVRASAALPCVGRSRVWGTTPAASRWRFNRCIHCMGRCCCAPFFPTIFPTNLVVSHTPTLTREIFPHTHTHSFVLAMQNGTTSSYSSSSLPPSAAPPSSSAIYPSAPPLDTSTSLYPAVPAPSTSFPANGYGAISASTPLLGGYPRPQQQQYQQHNHPHHHHQGPTHYIHRSYYEDPARVPPIVVQATRTPVGYELASDGMVLIPTSESVLMVCPYENIQVVTTVESAPGCMAYLTSLFLCVVGCGICFFLPFCSRRCQDQVHRCPSCRKVLAVVPA